MPTMAGTVDGWRARTSKKWYPSSGEFVACSSSLSIACNASCPTVSITDTTSSNYKYTTCIKVTTPSSSLIGNITQIAISFYGYDRNSTVGTLYGSLRTVDPATGSDANDTLDTYRTYVAGDSAEQSCSPTTTKATHTMTFSGSFSQNTSYYLYLYTKSSSDIYTFKASSTEYTCTVTYDYKKYEISYNANGHGTAPDVHYKTHDVALTLKSFIANQTGTGYTVSYNANGGNSTPANNTSAITYKQTYWNTNSSGTGTNYGSGDSYTANSAATLYAIWSATNGAVTLANSINKSNSSNDYTVSYNANGGDSTPSNQTLTRTIPYTFNKWNTKADGSGSAYSAGASYTPSAAVTMYATWTTGATTGSIKLASSISKKDTVVVGNTVTLDADGGEYDSTNLTNTNTISYTFKEWNTKADGSGISYSAEQSYYNDSNLSLYAIFNNQITDRSYINLPTPKKSGYIFLGWSTEKGSTDYVSMNYTPLTDVTLYANYKQGYNIEMYLYNGGRWMNVLMS